MSRSSLSRRQFLALTGTAPLWSASALPCQAASRWVDHRTHGPFQVQATFPLTNFAPLFQELSALELELQRTLAVPPARQRVDVYLLDDQQSHRELLQTLYPRVPYRRALYVQRAGHGSVYAYRHAELPVDLRHECTHALLHTNLPMVPLWLDEGLAEYFEMSAPRRAFGHPHLAKLRWNFRLGMVRGVESLESCQTLSDMGAAEYRFAWAWVHFMLHGPLLAHRVLVHFLRDVQAGNPPGKLSERMVQAVPNLQMQYARHFKNWHR
ncbi:MAG: DUF1570 domain-containing protein [Pirellulales bacterium]|nr:DUF1570 domain-containing protein [Pirellulales bacterium]